MRKMIGRDHEEQGLKLMDGCSHIASLVQHTTSNTFVSLSSLRAQIVQWHYHLVLVYVPLLKRLFSIL